MKKIIAVEDGLSRVIGDSLTEAGYKVVKPGAGANVDATIVTGMDMNVMGMQDIVNKGPVIDASGRTAAQIIKDLQAIL